VLLAVTVYTLPELNVAYIALQQLKTVIDVDLLTADEAERDCNVLGLETTL
jgi:hypothetical protein